MGLNQICSCLLKEYIELVIEGDVFRDLEEVLRLESGKPLLKLFLLRIYH